MELRHALGYDASADDVRAMLHDAGYWDRVAQATGAISSTCTVDSDSDSDSDNDRSITVVVDQEQQVIGVPAFAKKFVGDSTRAIKTMVWQGDAASFEVETPGKPTRLSGRATLEPRGAGTELVYQLEVRASVPLLGGRLEKLVVELTTEGFEKEQSVGAAWLAGEH